MREVVFQRNVTVLLLFHAHSWVCAEVFSMSGWFKFNSTFFNSILFIYVKSQQQSPLCPDLLTVNFYTDAVSKNPPKLQSHLWSCWNRSTETIAVRLCLLTIRVTRGQNTDTSLYLTYSRRNMSGLRVLSSVSLKSEVYDTCVGFWVD